MKFSTLSKLIVVVFFACSITACSKKSGSNPTPKISISSLSIATGTYGATVIITGNGFSATPTDDQVFFNGKIANISAATGTQLTVSVPLSAGTGNVTITVNGSTATGPIFTYQQSLIVSVLAGSGEQKLIDGIGISAAFFNPYGLVLDAAGNLYTADAGNDAIRKITSGGIVSTIAGGTQGSANGLGNAASFERPYGITIDASGNLYVADTGNGLIREVTPIGQVTAYNTSIFNNAYSITMDANSNIYIADNQGDIIKKVTPGGAVSIFAGQYGISGDNDGNGTQALFSNPEAMAADASGNIYVGDGILIRKITSAGIVSTIAGGAEGSADGQGTQASFREIKGITLDANGNIYVADYGNNMVRKVTPGGLVSTIVKGGNTPGAIISPTGIAVDKTGIIYVTETDESKIVKIAIQ